MRFLPPKKLASVELIKDKVKNLFKGTSATNHKSAQRRTRLLCLKSKTLKVMTHPLTGNKVLNAHTPSSPIKGND